MDSLTSIPGWLGAAAVGAVIAAAGYVGRLIVETYSARHLRDSQRVASLGQLLALLTASKAVFIAQLKLRNKLDELLRTRGVASERSYERRFTSAYSSFTQEERELHDLIRSYTEHGLFGLNRAQLDWLQSDTYFRAPQRKVPLEIRGELLALEAHLLVWLAKYEAWITDHAEHALVFVDDELKHGPGFRPGLMTS